MHNLSTLANDDDSRSRTEYSTRLIQVDDGDTILPYVRAVLETIGDGSAHVVKGDTGGGILLTAPIGVSHFLDSIIKTDLNKIKNLQDFENATIYSPPISFPVEIKGADLLRMITDLKLIPSDMNCDWIQVSTDRGVLFVSGPPADARRNFFKARVLPSLRQMIQLLEEPAFLAP